MSSSLLLSAECHVLRKWETNKTFLQICQMKTASTALPALGWRWGLNSQPVNHGTCVWSIYILDILPGIWTGLLYKGKQDLILHWHTCIQIRVLAGAAIISFTAHAKQYPPGNHLLTTGTGALIIARAPASEVKGHQYQQLTGGYDLEIGHFSKWLVWWLPDG